ncbi:DNA ligase [Bradyrhizobium sp. OAE829]|uniref:ATP-dependent DNA ligase n=1 Tax=Bradyrhizobium sp. OAE829 TaxID=2663807 RepID=UPI003395F26F
MEPCRPTKAIRPPSGPEWVHEIKHDGFRLLVRREGPRVRCFTWGGPAIVEAAKRLRPQSFLIDGEAVICRPDGVSDFDALRVGRRAHEVTLAAFDLIELQADDLRKEPLFNRKQRLARLLSGGPDAIVYNEHITHDGPTVFEHACRLGLEGIVSKRLDAPYRSGAAKSWLKSKNPLSEAVRRETQEDWS